MVKSRKIAFVLLLFSDGCQTSTRENITETEQRNYFYRVYYQENHQFNLLFFYVWLNPFNMRKYFNTQFTKI